MLDETFGLKATELSHHIENLMPAHCKYMCGTSAPNQLADWCYRRRSVYGFVQALS